MGDLIFCLVCIDTHIVLGHADICGIIHFYLIQFYLIKASRLAIRNLNFFSVSLITECSKTSLESP